MNKHRRLGIWMDHAVAQLMDFTNESIATSVIASTFTHKIKEQSLGKNENLMHNKEQHQQSDFFNKLKDIIRNYDDVLLFGPTTAKSELLNILKTDAHFHDIKIEIRHADKMTTNQQQAFVTEYFTAPSTHERVSL